MEHTAHASQPVPATQRGPTRRGHLALVEPPEPVDEAAVRSRAGQIYEQFGAVIYRRCLRLLRNEEAAKDATQDVFVKLLGQLHRFDEADSVLAWLYCVSSNHCLNQRRAAGYRGEALPESDLEALIDGGPSHQDRVLARQVLERFDEVTRLIAVGILVDGMEQEELAEALGLSRRSVARRLVWFLERARALLLEAAAEAEGEPERVVD